MCLSFIEIGQVVPKNQVFKVVKVYGSMIAIPSTSYYLHCKTCVPDTHTMSVRCEEKV